MKRLALVISLFALPFSLAFSQPLAGYKVCIDPGHGGYGSNDRHLIPDPGTDFWESESNFYKALHLKAMLEKLGATVILTRESNSGVVYDNPNDPQEPTLTARWTMANANNVDWFHSIHSNASGAALNTTVNRTIVLIKEDKITRQPVWPDAVTMSSIMYNQIRAHLGTQSALGNIVAGVYLDYTFYGGTNGGFNLGVLSGTIMPAELSEGSFHDFYPETRRLMNNSYRKLEAYALRNSFMQYLGVPADTMAYIRGIQTEEGSGRLINYSRVRLLPQDTVYVGDRYNNGFYLHDGLVPGDYTLIFETPGYVPDTLHFTATAGARISHNVMLRPFGAPSMLSHSPQNADSTMPASASLTFQFTKMMDTASVRSAFTISPHVDGKLLWSTGNTILTFDPDSVVFPFNVWFTVTLDTTARSVDGFGLDGNGDGAPDPFVLTFKPQPVDAWAPAITWLRPAQGDTLSSPLELINLTFDEVVAPSSVNSTNIAMQKVGSALQPLTFQTWSWQTRSGVNIFPTNGLQSGSDYRIRVYGVRDYAGNSIPATETLLWTFSVSGQAYTKNILDDFEGGVTGWIDPELNGGSSGFIANNTSWQASNSYLLPTSGNTKNGLLNYAWDTTAVQQRLRLGRDSLQLIVAGHARLQVHVWGDGSGNMMRFVLQRTSPAHPAGIEVTSPATTVSWVGWRLIEFPLDVDSLGTAIGDSADAGTVTLTAIDVLYGGGSADISGRLVFDDLQVAQKIITSVRDDHDGTVPTDFALSQNYPNPFNPSTEIRFGLPFTVHCSLKVFDLLGREVAVLQDGVLPSGSHTVTFDAASLPSGMYIVELRADQTRITQKAMLLK